MNMYRTALLMAIGMAVFTATANAAVTPYTDETAFLGQIGHAVTEDFDGPSWDPVRSTPFVVNAADSVTSQGITWTSSDQVTTSTGAGRSGYGIYAYPHGIPDAIVGHAGGIIFAVGVWVTTNTPFAKIRFILDHTEVVDFKDVTIGSQFVFLGVIATTGFSTFEIQETEGTAGDQKFIFMDDVTVSGDAAVVNQPPIANAGSDQNVPEGAAVLLDGTQSIDLDDGINTYSWVQTSGSPAVILSDAASPSPGFTAPQVTGPGASLVFTLTVTDYGGGQDSDQVVINVLDSAAGNQPPVADAGVDQTVDEGGRVVLDGSGSSDPDDGIATFQWRQIAGTPVVLAVPGAAMPTFSAPAVGAGGDVLIFELTVRDLGGLSGTDRVNVIVNDFPGSPPAPSTVTGSGGGGGGGCFVSTIIPRER